MARGQEELLAVSAEERVSVGEPQSWQPQSLVVLAKCPMETMTQTLLHPQITTRGWNFMMRQTRWWAGCSERYPCGCSYAKTSWGVVGLLNQAISHKLELLVNRCFSKFIIILDPGSWLAGEIASLSTSVWVWFFLPLQNCLLCHTECHRMQCAVYCCRGVLSQRKAWNIPTLLLGGKESCTFQDRQHVGADTDVTNQAPDSRSDEFEGCRTCNPCRL